ncbi:MAG TPA: DUF2723 domain-containing protein [Aggregatilinea sp.]|uniref:protein O-mannosyl-transferase family n=1 Tax=Aggregatilinea sp. TaxID=2806333 RepID=UPI002CD3484B|nr:DUF2723 domain-containing protein [Aggregatilinea sp.]HML23582.1 DUF2723 domain-containing protein [Aggregatilinea sp.]
MTAIATHGPSSRSRAALYRLLVPLAALILIAAYGSTLQTHVNGSSDEYMLDVGEIQVALNAWGTVHYTGYPLYTILGNGFTLPLRAVGLEPAAAASLYATAWGAAALICAGMLVWGLTRRAGLAALAALLLGLTRSVWIHSSIAEVYGMSLAITALMLLVALWPAPWQGVWSARRRFLMLALLGGIGVAHHRAVAFVAPGLFLALWPYRRDLLDRWPRTLMQGSALAALGFVPYAYLPLRAHQGSAWVYGDPGTWRGFWQQFTGKEADYLVTLPGNTGGLLDDAADIARLLVDQLTLPGLLIALAALAVAVTIAPQRRAARVLALAGAGPLIFSVAYHSAVLPGAILMPVVLVLVLDVALAADWLLVRRPRLGAAALAGLLIWALLLVPFNRDWIRTRTTDRSGQEMIDLVAQIPREGRVTFTLPWGPHYEAAAYSRLVTGENRDVKMVYHTANYADLLAQDYRLYTAPEAFYVFPPEWWRARLGGLGLTSAGPGLVELSAAPQIAGPGDPPVDPIVYGIGRADAWLTCDADTIALHVIWQAVEQPSANPSIFVHLTGEEVAPVLATADRSAPVYGFYPFTAWSPGERVRDDFTLPRLAGGTQVRFGLYEQDAQGQFVNYGETALPVAACDTGAE